MARAWLARLPFRQRGQRRNTGPKSESPKRGGRMRLGLTLAVRLSPQQLIYRRSPAVSVVPIPHSPQL